MKRILAILTLSILPLFAGCWSVNQQVVKGFDASFTVIEPEYREYVKKDPNLSDDEKKRRERLLDETKALIEEAKEK